MSRTSRLAVVSSGASVSQATASSWLRERSCSRSRTQGCWSSPSMGASSDGIGEASRSGGTVDVADDELAAVVDADSSPPKRAISPATAPTTSTMTATK
ncbi:MAG TPA: hypothetical protein VL362_02150 [Patescibacteria group bacterium]|nr:hypothetical protein [Patescibacteria group bacterium]